MIDDRLLRELDPARGLDPAPREDLLERLLAQPLPPAPRRRRLRSRRLLLLPVAAAVAAATVAVLLAPSTPPTLPPAAVDLAAKAYAQTTAEPGRIVHTLTTSENIRTTADGVKREAGSVEEWHRGDETHRLARYGEQTALDHVISSDGVMRQITDDGNYRIVRPSDNEDAANVIAQEQSGFLATFRRRYERGQLDPAGDVRFAGRPARRYAVSPEDTAAPGAPRLPGPQQSFYIDRETGRPLGSESTMEMYMSDGRGGSTPTTMRYVETVRTIEQLEPTPENLDKLRTLTLPRRRDANGCIRGPVTNARSSDSATKRDCGGTPGAVVGG